MKRLILLGLVAAAIGVVELLPWWGSLAVLVGLVLAVKLLAGRLLKRFFMGLFKAKGAALAGADATLHGITAAQPPKPDPEEEDGEGMEQGPLRWVHIDVTVHVPDDNTGKTPFRLWDPSELSLVSVDTKPGPPEEEDEDLGTIAGAEFHENGSWVTAEGKLEGSHRIRLHAGVKPGVQHFKLRYYFEVIENRDTARR